MGEFEIKIPVSLEDKTDGAAVIEKIDAAIEDATESAEKLGDAMGKIDKNGRSRGSDGRFLKMGQEADQATQKVDKASQALDKTRAQMDKMNRTRIEMIISALDKASPALKVIWGYAKNLGSKAIKMTLGLIDKATAPIKGIFRLLANPITMALSVAGIGLGAKDFFDIHSDFTTQMSGVRALTGATDQEFKTLVDTAKELGAATTFSASEAAKGMQFLGTAGWKTNEIIEAMPGLLNLAAAGGTELATAADIVSDVMKAMGMAADQSGRAADIFAKTATASNTSVELLGETMKYAAPIANSFGLSLEETAALAGQMANAGIKGSMAGTAIRSSLMGMAAPTKDAAELMTKLKLSYSNADGSMKSMGTIITDLTSKFSNLTEAKKLEYAETLFGTYAASGWLGVINQGAESYRAFEDAIVNSTGAAEEMAKIRLDNIGGDIEELSGAVETAKLDLMEKLDPHLRAGVQWFTGLIPGIKDGMLSLTDTIMQQAGEMRERISGVMDSGEWQNASIAGKAFMLWDNLIAEPFGKWWSGSGKGQVVGIAQEIGSTIGETLHGMLVGGMAILSGQDLDASGLKLSGIAQAGLTAGGEFASSFIGGLNFGDLASKIPGFIAGLFGNSLQLLTGGGASSMLSAVVLGKGISSASKGIGGFTKMVSDVKVALGGEATAAAGAAAKTGLLTKAFSTATSIGGGAVKLLAMVPGWGWAAAAAIAAVGIGVKVYNDNLEQHRQELMHTSDAGKVAVDQWKEMGEVSNTVGGLLDQRRKIEQIISINREGLSDEEIGTLKKRLTAIDGTTAMLTADLVKTTGFTIEEIEDYAKRLGDIDGKKAALYASLYAHCADTEKAQTVLSLLEQYNDASLSEDQKAKVTASLIANCSDQEKAGAVLDLLRQYDQAGLGADEKAKVTASVIATCLDVDKAQQVYDLLQQYNAAGLSESKKAAVSAQLNAICDDPAVASEMLGLFKQYASLESENVSINAELVASLPEDVDLETVIGQIRTLSELAAERDMIEFKLSAVAASPEEIQNYKDQLVEVNKAIADASGGRLNAEQMTTAELERQLALYQEIARNNLEGAVRAGRSSVDEQARRRDEYKANYETAQQQYGEVEGKRQEIKIVQSEVSRLLGEAKERQGTDGYFQWLDDVYDPQMLNLKERFSASGIDNAEGIWANINNQGAGAFDTSLQNHASEASKHKQLYDSNFADYNAQNANLVQQYMNEAGLIAGNGFKPYQGTQFGGKTIEELAPMFGQMNQEQKSAFTSMLDSLQQLNESAGYITDAEKLSVDNLRQIAEQSEAAAKAAEATGADGGAESKRIMSTEQVTTAVQVLQQSTEQAKKGGDTAYTKMLKDNEAAYKKVQEYEKAKEKGKDTSDLEKYFTERFGNDQWKYATDPTAALEQNVIQERQGIVQGFGAQVGQGYGAIDQIQTDYSGMEQQNAALEQQQSALIKAKEAMDQYNVATQSGDAAGQAQALEQANKSLEGTGQTLETLSALGGGDAIAGIDAAFEANAATIQANIANMEVAKLQYDEAVAALETAIKTYQSNAKRDVNDALKIEPLDASAYEAALAKIESFKGALGGMPNPDVAVNVSDGGKIASVKSDLGQIPTDIYSTIHILTIGSIPNLPSGGSVSASKNAAGGMYGKGAFLSWVAEQGKEAIIPLDGQYKARGIDLWMQAGRELGIMENAAGGIYASDFPRGMSLYDEPTSSVPSFSPAGTSAPMQIIIEGLKNEFKIEITGNMPPEAAEQLREQLGEIADDFAAQFAEKIEDIFSNQPIDK